MVVRGPFVSSDGEVDRVRLRTALVTDRTTVGVSTSAVDAATAAQGRYMYCKVLKYLRSAPPQPLQSQPLRRLWFWFLN